MLNDAAAILWDKTFRLRDLIERIEIEANGGRSTKFLKLFALLVDTLRFLKLDTFSKV